MPTIKIGNNTGDDYSGTEDASLNSPQPNDNIGSASTIYIWDETSYGDLAHGIIRFTGLDSIVGTITVSSASFFLYFFENSHENLTLTAKRLLRIWGEGVHNVATATTGESSWNHYAYPNTWTTAGALSEGNDTSATTSATFTNESSNSFQYDEFTAAQLATDVENMANGTWSNDGWMIRCTAGGDGEKWTFYGAKNYTDGKRPYLQLTYTSAGPASNVGFYYYLQQQ